MRIANTLHIGDDSVQQVVAAGNGLRQRLNDLLLRGASSPRFTCGISAMVRATASAVSFRPSRVALLICIYHKAYTSSSTAPMTLPIIRTRRCSALTVRRVGEREAGALKPS